MISSKQFADVLFPKIESEPNPLSRRGMLEFAISAHTEDLRREIVRLRHVLIDISNADSGDGVDAFAAVIRKARSAAKDSTVLSGLIYD